jgi:hypothetical protein
MIAALILSAAFVSQAPTAAQPKASPSSPQAKDAPQAKPKPLQDPQDSPSSPQAKAAPQAKPLEDPRLAQLKAFATQKIDPTLSKTKQAALKKKINRAKAQYNQRLQQLQDQAEYERLLPLMLKQQAADAKQQEAMVRNNALIRNANANEANARANAVNAEINRQRLLREAYPQYYGGR